jgi:hypothetical protein
MDGLYTSRSEVSPKDLRDMTSETSDMSNTISCSHCGAKIEISQALQGQIEQQVLDAAHKQHAGELAKVRKEAEEMARQAQRAAQEIADRKLAGERELLIAKANADMDLAKQKLESELQSREKRQQAQSEMLLKSLKEDASAKDQNNKELREQLSTMMQSLRDEKRARENAELDAQRKMALEEAKIREQVQKDADERQRLNLAAKEKTITDLQKALDDAQRKAAQGSQQLQGEIMELDLEKALADAWRDDDITPVPKGVNGADIAHTVRSPRGTDCGLMLWEIKRTKNWTEGWIPKLKEDVRSAKAAVAIIVTEAMPKQLEEDMGRLQGVWICKPKMAIVLGTLLREGLLNVARQKALADNRGDKAEALYNFVTSHEFVQQIENMVDTYSEMASQIQKERIAYQRIWSLREKQAQTLLFSTANIIGSMQGYVGQASMPKIKGLDLLDSGDDEAAAAIG